MITIPLGKTGWGRRKLLKGRWKKKAFKRKVRELGLCAISALPRVVQSGRVLLAH